MKKKLLSVLITAMLTLTACGSEAALNITPAESLPETATFTLSECFNKKTSIIDSNEAFKSYLNSRTAELIRVSASERVYSDKTASNPDESTVKNIMSYEVYAGHIVNECNDTFESRVYPDPKRAFDLEDIFGPEYKVSENDDLYDVYMSMIKVLNLDDYYKDMFVTGDYEVSKAYKNDALSEKACKIVSVIPQNEVFEMLLPDTDYKEVIFSQLEYTLAVDEENNVAFPSSITAFVQYVDTEGVQRVYSMNVSLVAFNDLNTIGEKLTQACACGDSCLSACGCD